MQQADRLARYKAHRRPRDARHAPFWIFFVVCFGFLAFLFGVFEPRSLNIVFACLFYFATGVTGMIIYASSDPYHDPGRVSAPPLLQLLPKEASKTPQKPAPSP